MDKILKVKKILITLIFISLALGQLARVPIGGYVLGLYLWDVLIGAYMILCEFPKYSKIYPIFYKIGFLWILWSGAIIIYSYRYFLNLNEYLISISYLIRWIAYFLFGFLLFIDIRENSSLKKFLSTVIIVFGVLISIGGFIQLLIFPDFSKLDPSLLWDPHKNRLVGTLFDPNFTGIVLVITFLFAMYFLLMKNLNHKSKLILMIYSFLSLFAIFLTFSRSAWLSLAVGIIILGILKYKWIIPLAVVMAFGAYYLVPRVQTRIAGFTDPNDSIQYRFESWSEAGLVIKSNPIIGYGFNSYRYTKRDLGLNSYENELGNRSGGGSDASLLLIWADTGIIGLIIYISFLFSIALFSLKKKNIFALAGFFAILVNSVFINSLIFPHVMILMMSTGALLFND